jgi:hypothetical protein
MKKGVSNTSCKNNQKLITFVILPLFYENRLPLFVWIFLIKN